MINRSRALFLFVLGVLLAQFLVAFPVWIFVRIFPEAFVFGAGVTGFLILAVLFIGTFVNKQAAFKIVIRIFFLFFTVVTIYEFWHLYSVRRDITERQNQFEQMQREVLKHDSIKRSKALDSVMSGVEYYDAYENQ